MIVNTIREDIANGSGWAIAAIRNGEVFAFVRVDDPTNVEDAKIELYEMAVVKEALYEDDEVFDAAQMAGDAEDIEEAENEWAEKYAVTIRVGMMSNGEFCHTFSAKEMKGLGFSAGSF